MSKEQQIEDELIARLSGLKYTYRKDIRDRNTSERIIFYIKFHISKKYSIFEVLIKQTENNEAIL